MSCPPVPKNQVSFLSRGEPCRIKNASHSGSVDNNNVDKEGIGILSNVEQLEHIAHPADPEK